MASGLGLVMFPLFFFVWTELVPQPYESLVARMIGAGLCGLLAVSYYWPKPLRPFVIPFSFITFVYCLPFFFTYMLLMNGATLEWQLSAMAAMMYMVFLIDAFNILPATIMGIVAAAIMYLLAAVSPEFPDALYSTLSIYGFTMVGLILLNHSNNLIHKEKMKAAGVLAGYIAHEMRTPLASIRFDAESLMKEISTYEKNIEMLPHQNPEQLYNAANRIARQTSSANAVINSLILNITNFGHRNERAKKLSMQDTVRETLNDFSFKTEAELNLAVKVTQDFEYFADPALMRHVVFNLVRNALRAVEATAGRVEINIEGPDARGFNSLIVSDDGPGIPPEHVHDIFLPFRSLDKDSDGTGLGLSFCRMVVEAAGGSIHCKTQKTGGAMFVVSLPPAELQEPAVTH